jgi:hypothetical protein
MVADGTAVPASRWRRATRSIEAAAIAGLVHAVLLTVAIILVRGQPGVGGSDEALSSFLSDPGSRAQMVTALNLVALSVIALLWFIAVIRRRIGGREDKLFATVFLGGGLLVAMALLVGFAMITAPAVLTDETGRVADLEASRLLGSAGSAVLALHAPRLAAVFVLATSRLGERTGALPRWLTLVGYLVAVAMIVNYTISDPIPFFFPVWVAVVSLALLVRSRRIPAAAPSGGNE